MYKDFKKNKEIKSFFIICDNDYFPQKKYAWDNININKIINRIKAKGFKVSTTTFAKIANGYETINNSFIYYASSQIKERKEYIEDVLISLMLESSNIFLPKYEIFRAHENKGFQEIYKKKIGINSLGGSYHIDSKGIKKSDQYPKVLKTIDGYGSSGVWLANDYKEANRIYNVHIKKKDIVFEFKNFVKRTFYKKKYSNRYLDYKSDTLQVRFVKQNFIENLSFDYKVLVFGCKYYILKRFVKKNDFRASGSGKWEFQKNDIIDKRILDFARDCYIKLDLPFVSLDICSDKNCCYLIEFQGIHMGPITLIDSKGYFCLLDNGIWKFINENSDFEEEIVNSMFYYIENRRIW